MPKIFGTNLIGIFLAAAAFWIFGSIWFGPLFSETWMAVQGMTQEMAEANMEAMGPMMFVWGFLISLLATTGLSYILHQSEASLLGTCAKIGAIVATLIVLPIQAYAVLYEGYPLKGLALDFGYIFFGFIICGMVLSFFRGKDAAA